MKKCPVCKTKLYDGDKQCCTCNYVFPPERPTSNLCLAGFICALVPGVVFVLHIIASASFNPVALIIGWIGLVLAFILSITGVTSVIQEYIEGENDLESETTLENTQS